MFFEGGVKTLTCPNASNNIAPWLRRRGWKAGHTDDLTCTLSDKKWMGSPIFFEGPHKHVDYASFHKWNDDVTGANAWTQTSHQDLREITWQYYTYRKNMFSKLLAQGTTKSVSEKELETQLEAMNTDGVWATVRSKFALAAISKRPVLSYEATFTCEGGLMYAQLTNPVYAQGKDPRNRESAMHLVFSPQRKHYYAAVPKKHVADGIVSLGELKQHALVVKDINDTEFYMIGVLGDGNCFYRAFAVVAKAYNEVENMLQLARRFSIGIPSDRVGHFSNGMKHIQFGVTLKDNKMSNGIQWKSRTSIAQSYKINLLYEGMLDVVSVSTFAIFWTWNASSLGLQAINLKCPVFQNLFPQDLPNEDSSTRLLARITAGDNRETIENFVSALSPPYCSCDECIQLSKQVDVSSVSIGEDQNENKENGAQPTTSPKQLDSSCLTPITAQTVGEQKKDCSRVMEDDVKEDNRSEPTTSPTVNSSCMTPITDQMVGDLKKGNSQSGYDSELTEGDLNTTENESNNSRSETPISIRTASDEKQVMHEEASLRYVNKKQQEEVDANMARRLTFENGDDDGPRSSKRNAKKSSGQTTVKNGMELSQDDTERGTKQLKNFDVPLTHSGYTWTIDNDGSLRFLDDDDNWITSGDVVHVAKTKKGLSLSGCL